MADETQLQSVQPDRPARPAAESREETIERVIEETDAVQHVHARPELEDPTSRRGADLTVARAALAFAAGGAVVGAVLALVLSLPPGPVETDSVGETFGFMAVLAVLTAIVVGLIATLILLAREDGRVEREVEQHQADEGTELYDREDAEGRVKRVEAELAAVARAERRIEDGTYGLSVESGAPISDARLEAVPSAEHTVEEEERFRGELHAPAPSEDEDDATPLDEPVEPSHDLAEIPMSSDHDPTVDPQEVDDEVRLSMAGEAYPGEGGAPDVGTPAVDDPAVDRRYRPER